LEKGLFAKIEKHLGQTITVVTDTSYLEEEIKVIFDNSNKFKDKRINENKEIKTKNDFRNRKPK
jgi:hypothetical protein